LPPRAPSRRNPDRERRRLGLALWIAGSYMVVEVVGGVVSGSLALLADAGHMFADTASLGLAYFALWMARRPAPERLSYGYRRVEVLAALANAAVLFAAAGLILIEAVERLSAPVAVRGDVMFAVAAGGLVANLVQMFVLGADREHSLNTRAAWLHVVSDMLGSVAALASGLGILLWGAVWLDPVASLAIALLVVFSAFFLLKRTFVVLMEGAPAHLEPSGVTDAIRELHGVESVHHVHLWTITSGLEALSAHVVVDPSSNHDGLLERIRSRLAERFHIGHVTIQIEHQPCREPDCPPTEDALRVAAPAHHHHEH
jgi:cobalt-zinc-cadmium efflux system protein